MNNHQTEQSHYWVSNTPADANSQDLFKQAKAYDLGIGVKADKRKAASLYREAMNQGDKKAKHNLAIMLIVGDDGIADKPTGIRMLQELADEGEALSIYTLGGCYMNGNGVAHDTAKGLELYHTASAMGQGEATYSIAAYYMNECHDMQKGIAYCEKAVEQGFAFAASMLAQIYDEGLGVEKDADKAMAYLKRGAELGDAHCQLKYGILLCRADSVQGFKWMLKSANQKNPVAMLVVGQQYLNSNSSLFADPQHFSIGVQMLREAAAMGVKEAQDFLAHYGLEHEQSFDERTARFYDILDHADDDTAQNAFQQMYECSELGDPIAQCILGLGYYYGNFVEQDKAKGMQLLKKAADSGCVDALNAMGLFLNEEKRYEEALPYHKRSAELGDMYGLHNLGNAYFYARGVERDVKKAIELWIKAAESGNPDSHCTLGNVFFRGEMVAQDLPKAIKYYTYAASRPCATQQQSMKQLIAAYHLMGKEEEACKWMAKLEKTEG